MLHLISSLKLLDPVELTELQITPHQGVIYLEDIDFGFPTIREVMEENPGAVGAKDYTTLYGSRIVTMVVRIRESITTYNELRYWCDPAKRITMEYTLDDAVTRTMELRASNFSGPFAKSSLQNGMIDVQLQWVCASGRAYSVTSQETFMSRQDIGAGPGRTYPLTYPRDYPDQVGTGTSTLVMNGTAVTEPILRIYGPLTGPSIENETLGRTLTLANLSISASDYIEIDMAEKTVQLNGVPGLDANRRSYVTTREWWWLKKGDNVIRFTATTGSGPNQLWIQYKDAWL